MDMKVDARPGDKKASDGTNENSDNAPVLLVPPAKPAPPAETAPPGPQFRPPGLAGPARRRPRSRDSSFWRYSRLVMERCDIWYSPRSTRTDWCFMAMSICARSNSPSTTASVSPRCWSRKATGSARGQVLARLDTSRLKPQAGSAEATVEAQQAVVQKLHHGSRPEEIAQAQANVASAKADQVNADQQLDAADGIVRG